MDGLYCNYEGVYANFKTSYRGYLHDLSENQKEKPYENTSLYVHGRDHHTKGIHPPRLPQQMGRHTSTTYQVENPLQPRKLLPQT
jgi:hypothetical protein